jgi:hypothetical protein
MITVEGKKYVVIENMGYVHDRGAYGKIIKCDSKERVVLKINGKWIFAKPLIRFGGGMTGQELKGGCMKEDRKKVLLKATYDLLKKCSENPYVEDVMSSLVFYDGANCDGSCLMEDIAMELGIE